MALYPKGMKLHSALNLDPLLIFQTSAGQKSVYLTISKTDQTARKLERILFGGLSSLDADILFLRPFSGLFDRNQVKGGAIFLKDTQWDAYSFRPWQMLTGKSKPQVVKGITTGLVFWDKTAIDWDYLEWFIGEHRLHLIPEWIMPTAQAGLAHRCEAKTISPRQITNLYPNAKIHNDTFGVHLLGSYRKQWMEKLEAREKKENLPIMTPSFEKCVSQNIFGYSLRQIKRWINTRLNLW